MAQQNWNSVGVNFSGSNQAMANASRNFSQVGTIANQIQDRISKEAIQAEAIKFRNAQALQQQANYNAEYNQKYVQPKLDKKAVNDLYANAQKQASDYAYTTTDAAKGVNERYLQASKANDGGAAVDELNRNLFKTMGGNFQYNGDNFTGQAMDPSSLNPVFQDTLRSTADISANANKYLLDNSNGLISAADAATFSSSIGQQLHPTLSKEAAKAQNDAAKEIFKQQSKLYNTKSSGTTLNFGSGAGGFTGKGTTKKTSSKTTNIDNINKFIKDNELGGSATWRTGLFNTITGENQITQNNVGKIVAQGNALDLSRTQVMNTLQSVINNGKGTLVDFSPSVNEKYFKDGRITDAFYKLAKTQDAGNERTTISKKTNTATNSATALQNSIGLDKATKQYKDSLAKTRKSQLGLAQDNPTFSHFFKNDLTNNLRTKPKAKSKVIKEGKSNNTNPKVDPGTKTSNSNTSIDYTKADTSILDKESKRISSSKVSQQVDDINKALASSDTNLSKNIKAIKNTDWSTATIKNTSVDKYNNKAIEPKSKKALLSSLKKFDDNNKYIETTKKTLSNGVDNPIAKKAIEKNLKKFISKQESLYNNINVNSTKYNSDAKANDKIAKIVSPIYDSYGRVDSSKFDGKGFSRAESRNANIVRRLAKESYDPSISLYEKNSYRDMLNKIATNKNGKWTPNNDLIEQMKTNNNKSAVVNTAVLGSSFTEGAFSLIGKGVTRALTTKKLTKELGGFVSKIHNVADLYSPAQTIKNVDNASAFISNSIKGLNKKGTFTKAHIKEVETIAERLKVIKAKAIRLQNGNPGSVPKDVKIDLSKDVDKLVESLKNI